MPTVSDSKVLELFGHSTRAANDAWGAIVTEN